MQKDNIVNVRFFPLWLVVINFYQCVSINNDSDKCIQAKTNNKRRPTFRRHLGTIVKGNYIKYAVSRLTIRVQSH